jgi:hypothetical protein
MNDEQKLYASAVGWEEKVDATSEEKRIAAFIDTHHKCRQDHVRPRNVEQCPTCGGWSSYVVTASDVPESLR